MADDQDQLTQDYVPTQDDPASPLEQAGMLDNSAGKSQLVARDRAAITKSQQDRDTAYGGIRDALDRATQRLTTMQIGPNQEESNHRLAASLFTNPARASANQGAYEQTKADIMREQRLGDIPTREKLMLQYQMAAANNQLQRANAGIDQGVKIQRADQMGAGVQARLDNQRWLAEFKGGVVPIDPGGDLTKGVRIIPQFAQNKAYIGAVEAKARDFNLVKQVGSDGSITYVPRESLLPAAQPPPAAPAPGAPPGTAQPNPAGLRAAAARSAALNDEARANAAAGQLPNTKGPIAPGLFPVYTGQLGGGSSSAVLGQPDMPQIYSDVANDAFSPQHFDGIYRVGGTGGVDPSILKANETDSRAYKKMADGAKEQNYLYGKMLHQIDTGQLNTGSWQTRLTALKGAVRGFVGDDTLSTAIDPKTGISPKDAVDAIMGDKIASEQEFDKLAWAAGTIGLTSKFGNRVLQAEFTANMKAQPNRDMSLLAMKMLMSAQMDRNLEIINKQKIHGLYAAHSGNPMLFDTFYDQHFDPYGQSPLAQRVQQREGQKAHIQGVVSNIQNMTPEQLAARKAALAAQIARQSRPMGPPVPPAPQPAQPSPQPAPAVTPQPAPAPEPMQD